MKIAIVCPIYPPAEQEEGVGHYTQCLAQQLSKSGNELVVIAGDTYRGRGVDGAVSVLKFPGKWSGKTAVDILCELQSLAVDVVNLQYTPELYPTGFKFAVPQLGVQFPLVVSFHTLWGGSKINHLLSLRLLVSADRIIALNSEVIYLLKQYLPFFLRKTTFVRIGSAILPCDSGVDVEEVDRRYKFDPDIPLLAHFGMCRPGKGLELLLDAIRQLVQRHGMNVHLVIIGGGLFDNPRYRKELEELTVEYGIENKVTWTGKLPAGEVSALISRSAAVVLPFDGGVSDRRSTLIAALVHRKPVVTTRPAVRIDEFRNSENMLWPESNDAKGLVEQVKMVLGDKQLRERLQAGAGELARHFEWQDIARKMHACFVEAVNK